MSQRRAACFLLLGYSAFCVISLQLRAQSMPNMPGMSGTEHHHHDDAPASMEKLGQVHFPVSCAARSEAPFERGIALLHSFGYTLAEQQFRSIAESDPTCAMAHWGIAMAQFRELWGRPDAEALKTGATEMQIYGAGAGLYRRDERFLPGCAAKLSTGRGCLYGGDGQTARGLSE
jgi:hypothetical protein